MDTKEIKKQIIELERKINVKFPDLYVDFLSKINGGDTFEIKNTGICMYSYSDLEERNETYQVYEFEPKYFMIGQDGDLAFFIFRNNPNNNSIYSNDLGALGSVDMKKEADNIFDFIKSFEWVYINCRMRNNLSVKLTLPNKFGVLLAL